MPSIVAFEREVRQSFLAEQKSDVAYAQHLHGGSPLHVLDTWGILDAYYHEDDAKDQGLVPVFEGPGDLFHLDVGLLDQGYGNVFFRDPEDNVIEIYAEY